jgi:sulfonate transport system permease protein
MSDNDLAAARVATSRLRSKPTPPADARRALAPPGAAGSSVAHAAHPWRWIVAGLLVPSLLLALWQVTTALGVFTPVQLPPPGRVLAAGRDLFERGLLTQYIGISTQRVLTGFAIGASLGLLVGALTGLARTWDALLGSTVGAVRAVPSLAWVPLLILWLKIGEESKITLIAIGAFFPVYTTVAGALRHVDRQLVEAGRAYGLTGTRLFATVQLPAVLPADISGLRLALAQAWLFLVAAELIASSAGLGFLLVDSQNNGRVDRILLAIISLAVLGKATDALLGIFERWAVHRWT